ncbi:hypothetical protein BT96DRAFT_981906 [Gymnopus androsaceus JB14]|uniref:Uncharacterized protein n=1 Tax=Gymnopus androsaceus JB14 TaxID=1447944 RepID=A0A6A4GJR9_9AGAR|nr:hypothetical protein BT96DRAFT_981906 [Gymnopus androsaceus JB14]
MSTPTISARGVTAVASASAGSSGGATAVAENGGHGHATAVAAAGGSGAVATAGVSDGKGSVNGVTSDTISLQQTSTSSTASSQTSLLNPTLASTFAGNTRHVSFNNWCTGLFLINCNHNAGSSTTSVNSMVVTPFSTVKSSTSSPSSTSTAPKRNCNQAAVNRGESVVRSLIAPFTGNCEHLIIFILPAARVDVDYNV